MKKIYCKQVDPELQEDNLFWIGKNKDNRSQLHWEDDIYADNVVICGNDDYLSYYTKAYEKVLKIDDVGYEYDCISNPHTNHCYWDNVSQLINYYFAKENGKKYSKKEIHEWKRLMDYWQDSEEDYLQALQLITGKKWRQVCIKGCCQRDWQYLYVSEEITDKDIDYIEMCYFNTGTEWLVFESEKDFEEDNYSYSLYVDGYNVKTNLVERIGCKEEELVCLEFNGYIKTPQYKEI